MTLAFNLGIFFRNLEGEEVRFTARNAHSELHFQGGVVSLSEQVDLTRELRVALVASPLRLELTFEEPDEEDAREEDQLVVVSLRKESEDSESVPMLRTAFQFGDITLTPLDRSMAREPKTPGPHAPGTPRSR